MNEFLYSGLPKPEIIVRFFKAWKWLWRRVALAAFDKTADRSRFQLLSGNISMEFLSFGFSDVGKRRNRNEDSYLCNDNAGLYLIADGMGGHASGETASRLAVNCIEEFVIHSRSDVNTWPVKAQEGLTPEQNRLYEGTVLANLRILQTAEQLPETHGMGTTLTGFLIEKDHLAIAHVGDSRLYRIRAGKLDQMTQDHTYVGRLVQEGRLTSEEAKKHKQRHILTNALGIQEDIKIDISRTQITKGDLFLICSDGLYDMLDDRQILEKCHVSRDKSLYKIGLSLVLEANLAGGLDNITVVLLSFEER